MIASLGYFGFRKVGINLKSYIFHILINLILLILKILLALKSTSSECNVDKNLIDYSTFYKNTFNLIHFFYQSSLDSEQKCVS